MFNGLYKFTLLNYLLTVKGCSALPGCVLYGQFCGDGLSTAAMPTDR